MKLFLQYSTVLLDYSKQKAKSNVLNATAHQNLPQDGGERRASALELLPTGSTGREKIRLVPFEFCVYLIGPLLFQTLSISMK